ncbi:hypothetical protein HSB1_39430 [Halogranum salarium B-1]|uniref:Uncharacterized protein n=1 Tax=Halogranum salarium B-1 TaxID=1210908 RepID=J3ETQ6_9EURY|nr:hypothetical protein HSB1_39430 [Halogranum salarium B-1]
MLLLYVAGFVPVIGGLVTIGVILTGVGAVVVTHFGLIRFEPMLFPE